jgi:hypothetical protein
VGSDTTLRFVAPNDSLEFAFPVCGQGLVEDPGTCPNVRLPVHSPGEGCGLAPGPAGLVPLLVVALMALGRSRSPRWGLLALLLLPLGARAASPPDQSPRTELHAGLAVLGSDRVVPDGLDRGAPWMGNPFLGLDVRQALWSWKEGRNLGLLGGLRGFVGRAAPFGDRGAVNFTLVEPTLSVDLRHGHFLERGRVPHVRYGAGLALPVMAPSVSAAKVVPSGILHVGAGLWLGRGLVRHELEVRLAVVPRTDGFVTRYHENTGIPGFTWYPGTVNVWLLAGRAWYGPVEGR